MLAPELLEELKEKGCLEVIFSNKDKITLTPIKSNGIIIKYVFQHLKFVKKHYTEVDGDDGYSLIKQLDLSSNPDLAFAEFSLSHTHLLKKYKH